jgi:hypothetical protein
MRRLLWLWFILFSASFAGYSQKVIFLHHSTGDGVYNEGQVASWMDNYNSQHQKNYVLTERSYPDTPYPWENYPYDYWNLWINGACNSGNPNIECLSSLCSNYDVIIFKHCFPGAGIGADDPVPDVSSPNKTLANYKLQYRALRDLLDSYPDNKFIIWTLTPLHRLATTDQQASRAHEFVQWVKNEWLQEDGKAHPNIYVFDFFGLMAEYNSSPTHGKVYCLKYDFETSHFSDDSHPNAAANAYAGPVFGQFMVDVIENVAFPSALQEDPLKSPVVYFHGDILDIRAQQDAVYQNLRMLDVMGKEAYNRELYPGESEVNLPEIPGGWYLVQLTSRDKGTRVVKVFKK